MPSLVYYGLDKIDNIPATIPLTDTEESITKKWNFVSIVVSSITINSEMLINAPAQFKNGITVEKTGRFKNDVLINGDLYVNTKTDTNFEDANNKMNIFQATVNSNGTANTANGGGLLFNTNGTVIKNTNGGRIFAGEVMCSTYSARYRDLAERFAIDEKQPKGTIVTLGGDKEITICKESDRAFGIIASDPAVRMNSDAGKDDTHPFVCWCGRVPCRVIGKVRKFDKIVISHIDGVGCVDTDRTNAQIIGIALKSKLTEGEGLVEVITQASIY